MQSRVEVPFKSYSGLIVRMSPHYRTGTDDELVGYAPTLIKTVPGRMPAPKEATKLIKSAFKNNSDVSAMGYVGPGMTLENEPTYYRSPKVALEAIKA